MSLRFCSFVCKTTCKEIQRRKAALQCAIEVPPPPATPSPALLGLGFALLVDGQFTEASVPLRQLLDRFEGEYPRSHHHPHLPAIAHSLLSLAMGMGRGALLHEALHHAREAEKFLRTTQLSLRMVVFGALCSHVYCHSRWPSIVGDIHGIKYCQ